MCFGAAASVWNFNRAADAVQMLLRSLLLVLLGHFVDDFNGVDAADLADSAHHAVADFFALLGLQTKPSKAQAPAKRHVVQGVELSIRPEGVELSPTAQRTQKILGQIDGALARDSLSPDEASRLAGRLTFLSQSTFGATGRAAIKPLYSRAATQRPTPTTPSQSGCGPPWGRCGDWWRRADRAWSPGRGGSPAPSRCSTPTRSSWTGTSGRSLDTWRPEKPCRERLGGRMVGATSCS